MNIKTIQKVLVRLSLYYPQAKRTPGEIEQLSKMWMEDVGHIPEDRFLKCVQLHRQRSAFFPVGVDILQINAELLSREPRHKKLPEPEMSEEDIEKRKAFIKNLRIVKGV